MASRLVRGFRAPCRAFIGRPRSGTPVVLSRPLFALLLLVAAACAGGDRSRVGGDSVGADAGPVVPAAPAAPLVDDFGDTVRSAHPRTIVSLNPATTEILFALGAGDRVVGRTTWDWYPAEARRVKDFGAGIRPNLELLLGARPDLVVLYATADNRQAARALREAGIATLTLRIDRIEQFRSATRLLGRVIGDSARAELLVDTVDATLTRVRTAVGGRRPVSAFWRIWDPPLLTIGRGSFMTELVEIAGGTNVFADMPAPSPQVSLEEVARRSPEVVLTGPDGAKALRAQEAWRVVPAVRAGRLAIVDTTLVGRPGPRLGEAAASLAKLLHPGALP